MVGGGGPIGGRGVELGVRPASGPARPGPPPREDSGDLFLEQSGGLSPRGELAGGRVPAIEELLTLSGAQDRVLADGHVGPDDGGFQQHAVVAGEASMVRRSKRSDLKRIQPLRAPPAGCICISMSNLTRGRGRHPGGPQARAAEVGRRRLPVLEDHLDERVAVPLAFRLQLLHEPLEREVLMLVGSQCPGPGADQQVSEGGIAGEVAGGPGG